MEKDFSMVLLIHPMRPHVVISCAASLDGKTARPDGSPLAISSSEDFARVHRLRAASDAILVGVNTVIADDPSLVVKQEHAPGGKNPMRVVLDSNGRTPGSARVLDGRAKTVIFTNESCSKVWPGADVLRMGKSRVDLDGALHALRNLGVRRLMVEGGGTIIWEFLKGGLADELKVFVGDVVVGGNGPSLTGAHLAPGDASSDSGAGWHPVGLKLVKATAMPGGVLLEYVPG
jgi:2,5-diamino-6-(ribosylamino)-4(3H)-pyrimidinone 5'-phosphate reductase